MRTQVLIPTYQELHTLGSIIHRIFEHNPSVHILVIDDNSPDGTGELAEKLKEKYQNLEVLHREKKLGLGAAYIAGFKNSLDKYDVLVEMDADGSHDPIDLVTILQEINHFDCVLGSRWVPGGRVVNWHKSREILSRGGNAYARAMLGFKIGDATGGFRAYKTEKLKLLNFDAIDSQGYCFQVDMVRRFLDKGFTVKEVPITFTERTIGTSKMSQNIVIEAFLKIGVWGLQRLFGKKIAS
jgi:dolichol-phosphate mannosyltransferase